MANEIIIGGKKYPCKSEVVTYESHGLTFKPGKGARKRDVKKTTIDMFVVHYTAGEGNFKSLFNVLNARELGVEFYINKEGVIYQYADPILVDTFDAGTVNPRSIGVEVQCYGFVSKGGKVPAAGKDRPLYDCTIRGNTIKMASFTDAQQKALEDLLDTVLAAVPTIPRQTPADSTGTKAIERTLTQKELREASGILSHYAISSNKWDPGSKPMTELLKKGYKPIPYKD